MQYEYSSYAKTALSKQKGRNMSTYRANIRYSYSSTTRQSRSTQVHSILTVKDQSETELIAAIKRRHGDDIEVTINSIQWK